MQQQTVVKIVGAPVLLIWPTKWNSGTIITSLGRGNALSGGMGQFYLTTHDGTIYAFGFSMEH